MTAIPLSDVTIAAVIGACLVGATAWRLATARKRPRAKRQVPGRLISDIPTGRIVIASGLVRSKRG
jgi:hypothetical protein